MAKPVLFMDFDGFKFDTLQAHISYINARYGISSCAQDYVNNPPLDLVLQKYLPKGQCPTRDEIYEDLGTNLIASHTWHQDVTPMEGMCEVLPKLARKYEIWTVTARQRSGITVIRHLLEKHVPNCISGIHCVWEHLGNKEFREVSKRQFISEFQGEKIAFLDDSATEILEVQPVLPSYLFDPDGVNDHVAEIQLRIRSWKEVGERFL